MPSRDGSKHKRTRFVYTPGSSAATRSPTGTLTGRGGRSCAAGPSVLSGKNARSNQQNMLSHWTPDGSDTWEHSNLGASPRSSARRHRRCRHPSTASNFFRFRQGNGNLLQCRSEGVAHCGAIWSPIMPVAIDAGPSIRNPRNAYSPNAAAHPHCKSASPTRLSKQNSLKPARQV